MNLYGVTINFHVPMECKYVVARDIKDVERLYPNGFAYLIEENIVILHQYIVEEEYPDPPDNRFAT